ncbi:DNA polymerase I [Candidatus Uhrbacteria bacterium]|nr:DNA polymerase I [Candidatus Uhrbacteria bacterium]
MERLYILDANALLHRAWHAIRPLTNPKGEVVNCVYGMMMSVMKLLNDDKPDAFIACWDTEAPTFRHEAYEAYKANRVQKEDELYAQIPWVKEGLALLGVPSLEKDGFEADDLIGTFAERARKAGWEVVIVTGDRDALQLVRPGVSVMAFKKGVTETKMYDLDAIMEEYGLTPEQFIEYKAMRGDPSDNIPGIKGIGEKGATELLKNYGNLKEILKAAHDKKSDLSVSTREKLLRAEKEIPAIINLVTIDKNVPIDWKPEAGTFPGDRDGLLAFLHANGFKSLLGKIPGEVVVKEKKVKGEKKSVEKVKPELSVSLKNILLNEIRVEKKNDVKSALDILGKSENVVVRAVRTSQGSLFGNDAGGLMLADDETAYLFPASTIESAKASIQEFLSDDDVKLVGHDAKQDMKILEAHGLEIPRWSFDTMLAGYVLGAGERNHDLSAIAAKFASVQLEQDAGPLAEASVIRACVAPLMKSLKEESLIPILEKFELPLLPVLRAMERKGILINREYLRGLSKEMSKAKQEIEVKMIKAGGMDFNPGSPTQLAEVLFVKLGLATKGVKRGKTGFSTAAQELEKLRGTHPIIEMIEEYREVSKLLSTYVDVLPDLTDKEGRIHTTYDQAVAATGRLSSSEPNLQNIPIRTELGRKIRRAFIAGDGMVLLSCDYSQIELRLVAELAKDKSMLAAFKNGEDVHTATASSIWGISLKDVTKDQRRIAKAINFGLIFGQGPQGLAQSAGISFKEAREFIDKYFQAYTGIKQYMVETKESARRLGYVETIFGRKRYLPEIHSALPMVRAQAERMAINMPVQGSEADLIKLAMIEIAKKLSDVSPASHMLLQVHDELLFEVPIKDVEKVATFAKGIMEDVKEVDVPIVVESKAGKNWEEMKEVK